jgi:hypothetical protein
MGDGQSRVQEYRGRAAILRQIARETRDQGVRERLVLLAARFEVVADQVEKLATQRPGQTDRQTE